jgi:acetylornithine deacetylase/succinyl-diaminopimelate desuccinylase-like protein
MTDRADLAATLAERLPAHRGDLEAMVRIPSISAPGFDPAEVRRSAEFVRDLLAERGLNNAQLLEVDDAHPAVYADWLHAEGAPTVLLYAHHDVQPTGEIGRWSSPPFEPTERDGRLFARGAADDKAGVMVHVAAIDTWLRNRGRLPCNVKVFIEGEEEIGSEHLPAFIAAHIGRLHADVMVLTDTVNWKVGVPTLTYLLRGGVDATIEVRSLDHAVHSGMYGGPVPDPITGLTKLLAAATDDTGQVAIPGFSVDVRQLTAAERERILSLGFDEAEFRAEAGLLDGVELIGDPEAHVLERLWVRPSFAILGLDAPAVDGSSPTLTPSARARVAIRLAPGQDPVRARDLLCQWLADNVPWGLQATVTPGHAATPFRTDPSGPAFQAAERAMAAAYGRPTVAVGIGGTIPFVTPFTEAFGGAPALLAGVEDPDTRAHGIDESLHLEDWHRACLAEVYLLDELATAL